MFIPFFASYASFVFLGCFLFLFSFCIFAITIEPIKFQTNLAPQNDRLNFSFMEGIYVIGEKRARNNRKTEIQASRKFWQTVSRNFSHEKGYHKQILRNCHNLTIAVKSKFRTMHGVKLILTFHSPNPPGTFHILIGKFYYRAMK